MNESTPLVPLSVVMITNRNNDVFKAALASCQFAEEILLFDNQSGNDWQDLASQYRFKAIAWDQPLTDFAEAKNHALEFATHNWILFLDSDEVLPPNAGAAISKVIRDNLYEGLLIKRTDLFLNKPLHYGEAGTTYLVRLVRKRQLKFSGAVHEVPHFPGSVGNLSLEITHYAHASVSEFLADVGRYAQLRAGELKTSLWQTYLELLTFPIAKFIGNYIFKLGFLDGWRGFLYAFIMSLHSAFVRIYRLEKLLGEATSARAQHS